MLFQKFGESCYSINKCPFLRQLQTKILPARPYNQPPTANNKHTINCRISGVVIHYVIIII